MSVQWWCSATGQPWTWRWRAYPGIWLVVVGAWFVFDRLRKPRPTTERAPASNDLESVPTHGRPWAPALEAAGILLLWLTLDWPVGPLGAGYLASVHAVQFIMLAMVVPPLLLLSVNRSTVRQYLDARPLRRSVLSVLTHPLVAAGMFTIIMVVTHAPVVVDGLMSKQLGAMALDLAWFISGIWLWWPIIIALPERAWFQAPLHALYLFFATQVHLFIGTWLLTATFPVYATYELVPRVSALSAQADQQVAGGILVAATEPLVLGVISAIFLRWFARQERANALASAGDPPRSEAV